MNRTWLRRQTWRELECEYGSEEEQGVLGASAETPSLAERARKGFLGSGKQE